MKVHITIDGTPDALAHLVSLGIVRISQLAGAGADESKIDHVNHKAMEMARDPDGPKIWREFSGIVAAAVIELRPDSVKSPDLIPTPHAGNPGCYICQPKVAPIDWGKLGERETFDTFNSLEAGPRWAHWEYLDARHCARIASSMKAFNGPWNGQFKSPAEIFVKSLATPDEFVQYAGMAEAHVPGEIRDKLRVDAGAIGKPLDLDAAERYAALLAEFFLQMGLPVNPFKPAKPAKAPRAQKARA